MRPYQQPALHTRNPHARHTARMGVSYMVRGRTRLECQAALDRLCRLLDATPTLRPTDRVGPGWIARAVHTPTAPVENQGRTVQ
jgi:hypothetical protein